MSEREQYSEKQSLWLGGREKQLDGDIKMHRDGWSFRMAIEYYLGITAVSIIGGLNSNSKIAVSVAVLVSGLAVAKSTLFPSGDRSIFRNSDEFRVKTKSGIMGE